MCIFFFFFQDFTCVNLAVLAFVGLVASEADPQLVYQQPSYIYPGGHPVYRMAGLPYAYPVYNPVAAPRAGSSIASGPEMGEIVKDFKPAPAFYGNQLKLRYTIQFCPPGQQK